MKVPSYLQTPVIHESRIRTLEAQVDGQKKELREMQHNEDKKIGESDEVAEELRGEIREIHNAMHKGREKVKQSEEMALFVQSQIRVLDVILKEQLVSEEERKSRTDGLITNLEELNGFLHETSKSTQVSSC